jgi:Flp pilus assembly protein TadG
MVQGFLRRLLRDKRGTAAIETALVAPVLVLMSLGSFQVSTMVARQAELQSAIAEASAIALAAAPDTEEKRATLRSVIQTSSDLNANHVTVTAMYRCGTTTALVDVNTGCGTDKVSNYVKIVLTDTYTPVWTSYGVGRPLNFSVTRYVLIKQAA